MFKTDKRIVLTLDAGGTNFVFSAIQGYKEIVEPVRLNAVADDIEGCLDTLKKGFRSVMKKLGDTPVAISFAFPGPADYERGVIGDLPNFPAFRGGVALGPYLQGVFQMPVFINNDGNLLAYGEALQGLLPEVNAALAEAGNARRYRNLIGITLGTGFGAGVVIDGTLLRGDNGCGGDVWCMRNRKYPELIAEESVSIRAVRRVYGELSGQAVEDLTPYDIFLIAEGQKAGHVEAARQSFYELGMMAGEAIVAAINIADGIVSIGGGLAGAGKYIMLGVMEALHGSVGTFAGARFSVLQMETYNWEDPADRQCFLSQGIDSVIIPRTAATAPYLRQRSICVGLSKNGASTSIMYGAYAYALHELGK